MDSSDESDGDFVPGQGGGGGGGSEADSEAESSRRPGGGSDGDGSSDEEGGVRPARDAMDYGDDEDFDDAESDIGSGGDEEEGSVPLGGGSGRKRKKGGQKGKGRDKDKKKRNKKKKKSSSASGGGGSGASGPGSSGKGKRKRMAAASSMFDDEAEESDRGGGSGRSDEDDDEDEDNEYRYDGFVVSDREGSADERPRRSKGSSGGDNKRKRLRKAREEHGLEAADDEDLELIREAQGVGSSQPLEPDRNELVASDGRELGKQLFDGEVLDGGEARRQQDPYRRPRQRHDDFDSDDDGDFIVDDLGTERRRPGRQQEQSMQGGASGPSQDQVFEAMEIFGEGIQHFDFMKPIDEDEDGEGGEGKGQRANRDARRKALAGIEPSLLKEKFLTEQDKGIQDTDRPERLQLRMPSRGEASDQERQDEAQWICNQLDLGYNADESMAKKAVEHVLRFLGVESQEVPFIWHYRRDYLWTGPSTYLTREHLWKIYELDEMWDKVGNRREKIAKASGSLWKLMDGGEASDDEADEGYMSETADARDERLAEEETSNDIRQNRLRRSELALENAKATLAKAEDEASEGFEAVNEKRLEAAKAAKQKEGGDGGVEDGDWHRATEEGLQAAVEEAKVAHSHATSYLIGLKGELAVEEQEIAERDREREARRQERRDAAAMVRQQKREEARAAMEEEAALFPSQQYSFMLDSQEEIELKDMQDYFALVSLMGEAEEKLRGADGADGAQKRRPRRAGRADDSLYRAARQAGLRGLADRFSITAAQLGEVLQGLTMARYPVPTPLDPVDLVSSDMAGASDTPLFDSPESILRGVRHILAREIAAEPRVKAKCRQVYRRFALVSTNPTARGKEEIDAFHSLYGLHYLSRKDVGDFFSGEDRTQWLKIEKGRAEGLVTYTIHPPERLVQTVDDTGNMVEGRELDTSPFVKLLNPTYNPGGGGLEGMGGVSVPVKQGWDHQRTLILHEALVEHLLPSLETEVVTELKAASRAAVVEEASRALQRRLAVGPYEREELSVFQKIIKAESELKHDQLRVVGIFVTSDNREESWAAAIDPSGAVLDHLQLPFGRDAKAKKLKQFLRSTRPHVVGVSTSAGQACRSMMDMLVDRRSGQNGEPRRGVVPDAHKEYQHDRGGYDDEEDEDEDPWKHCSVLPVKDDVACVFARSIRGEKEFADFTVNQRAAVALARYLQDPLVEIAGMWTTMDSSGNFGHETFSLRLHPLQEQVPPQQLLKVWTHRLMDAVSDVGVDINHAAEHEHAMGVLQFVPGLGPRKAAKLRERLGTVLGGVVPSRKALLSSQLLKSLVYTNAAGFLRIRERGKLAERLDGQLDPFDDTRVHPECYNTQDWAQRICANALDVQVDDDYFPIVESAMDDSREALQKFCQQDMSADPRLPPMNLNDQVNQLDLSAYADELERQGEGKRALQLDSIVEEIRYPYRDRRQPYTAPGEDELFEWLTGETDATLREGVLVPVRVMKHNDGGVRVRLEGGVGLFGFVPTDYATDDVLPSDPITGQSANLRQVVKENQLMEAAIIKVDKARFELKLSLRKSDTQPNPDKWDAPLGAARVFGASGWNRPHTLPRLDAKFDVARAKQEARDRIRDAHKRASDRAHRGGGGGGSAASQNIGVRFPRSIMHPQYKNMTHVEAEKHLTEMSGARGEALIRPSSKGSDHLSLTWMWIEGEFMHTDIQEVGKQPGAMLAPRLKIKGEEYEDLDEIISRRVSACNDLVNDLLASNKYNTGTVEEVEELLRTNKGQEPNRIPYLMCRRGSPGYVNLMYLPANSVKKLLVEITPEGYVMSKRCFKTLPELFKWFKLNAQQLSRTSSRRKGSRQASSSSANGNAQQPPLPPETPDNVPPPPPPRPSAQQQQPPQQYPAYSGGAYGYNQPQPAYAPPAYYNPNAAPAAPAAPAPPPRAGSRWGAAPSAGAAAVAAQGQAYQAQYAQPQQQWYGDPQQQQQLYQQQYQGGAVPPYQPYAQQAGGGDRSQGRPRE